MSIREMYEYIYYKFYKSMIFVTSWGADWRASGVLLAFEAIFVMSFLFLYRLLFPGQLSSDIGNEWFIVPGIILYAIDTYVFHSKGKWKEIVKKYDAWPQKKNFRGTIIVWGIVILLLAYSFWIFKLYSKVDWSQYQ